MDATAPDIANQQTTDGKCVVSNELRIQSESRLAGVELVVRIHTLQFVGRLCRLLVSLGHQHQTNDVFHVPVVFHQLNGKPIEQFRVCRQAALSTEIIERRRQALPVKQFPKTIDQSSCR